jgi:hypothetical protein
MIIYVKWWGKLWNCQSDYYVPFEILTGHIKAARQNFYHLNQYAFDHVSYLYKIINGHREICVHKNIHRPLSGASIVSPSNLLQLTRRWCYITFYTLEYWETCRNYMYIFFSFKCMMHLPSCRLVYWGAMWISWVTLTSALPSHHRMRLVSTVNTVWHRWMWSPLNWSPVISNLYKRLFSSLEPTNSSRVLTGT